MAHGNCESMRSRAFTKGRSAFDSDDEYRRALNGEFDDVREDFSYEANEDPDDGEGGGRDAGDLEDLTDEEAVKAELDGLEDRIGGTKFREILERFMKDCSGRKEPPYLPFPPVRDKEVLAGFRDGSGGLRLRYGAYGFEADRLERTVGAEARLEVVKTWKGLSTVEVLYDWDDALCELAEEAEIEKEDLEDARKDEFFGDTLPGVLADRKRGAAFIDSATKEDGTVSTLTFGLSEPERLWLVRDRAKHEFRLEYPPGGVDGISATWDEEEFLEKLREMAWDDADARKLMLGGGDVEKAWDALDDLWYDEEDDGFVMETVDRFLDNVKSGREKGSARVRMGAGVVGGSGYGDAGRVDMTLEWSDLVPDMAQLTVHTWLATGDKDEDTYDVPLAFLRWWAFGRARGW